MVAARDSKSRLARGESSSLSSGTKCEALLGRRESQLLGFRGDLKDADIFFEHEK